LVLSICLELNLTQDAGLAEIDAEIVSRRDLAIIQMLDQRLNIKILRFPTDLTLEFVQFATCPCAAWDHSILRLGEE